MTLDLQPVRVATGSDEEGRLVFTPDGRLVAVLVMLSADNEVAPGQWYLEVGFGALDSMDHGVFADLATACDWMTGRLAADTPAS
jgi:hypothetical protein